MTTETKTIGIQSLQIGLNILEILAMEKEPLKFTDIQNLTAIQIGTHLPISSSTGVVFSTFEKDFLMKEWEEDELSKFNESQLQQFQVEKEKTRGLFFASKTEPLLKHVSSLSVPLLNFNHELLGAITIVGITETVPKSQTIRMDNIFSMSQRKSQSILVSENKFLKTNNIDNPFEIF